MFAKIRYTARTVYMDYTLTVTLRTTHGSRPARRLRVAGLMPAIVYGEAGKAPVSVSVPRKEFLKVLDQAGETGLVTLKGLDAPVPVLIHDVTFDALSGDPLHADFLQVRTDKVVEVEVPLEFVGVAPAEKELGGNLVKVKHELLIEAFPQDLPSELTVDISLLKTFDDQILVKDLVMPKGVQVLADADEVVALVQAHEEEGEVAAPADIASIEVEKRGKEEESA